MNEEIRTVETIGEALQILNDEHAAGVASMLDERGNRYGKFENQAALVQELKCLVRNHVPAGRGPNQVPAYVCLRPYQKEAIDMILTKIGRIMNGNPDYADSWDDIAGYAKLVSDRLGGNSR